MVHLNRKVVSVSLLVASLAAFGGTAFASPGHAHGEGALPSLTQEQKEKIAEAKTAERTARTALDVALAAQVERGAVDRAAVAPQIAAEKKAEADLRATFDRVLTAEQKAELAKKRAEHQGHAKGKHEHMKGQNGLGLTDAQKEQIKARMANEPQSDKGVDRKIDHLDAMAPVLTQAQRTRLAAKLRK